MPRPPQRAGVVFRSLNRRFSTAQNTGTRRSYRPKVFSYVSSESRVTTSHSFSLQASVPALSGTPRPLSLHSPIEGAGRNIPSRPAGQNAAGRAWRDHPPAPAGSPPARPEKRPGFRRQTFSSGPPPGEAPTFLYCKEWPESPRLPPALLPRPVGAPPCPETPGTPPPLQPAQSAQPYLDHERVGCS